MFFVLPHANAGEERVYLAESISKIIFRAKMGFHMLGSLLTVKLTNANAVSFKPDHELQKSAKKATVEYNKEHLSSTSDIKHGKA